MNGSTRASCGCTTRFPEADSGEIERPWRVILVKPVNALRHRQHNVY